VNVPKFTVSALVTISLHTEVEAPSLQEAVKEAESREVMRLCHVCSGQDAGKKWVTSGELDGTPEITEVEEAFL
jgi:hypothetical protein